MLYLLDACALLAVFNGEPGANVVLDLLERARAGAIRLTKDKEMKPAEEAGEFPVLWVK